MIHCRAFRLVGKARLVCFWRFYDQEGRSVPSLMGICTPKPGEAGGVTHRRSHFARRLALFVRRYQIRKTAVTQVFLLLLVSLAGSPANGYAQGPWGNDLSVAPSSPLGCYPAVRVAPPLPHPGGPIRLQVGTFVPTRGEALDIPAELRATSPGADEPGYYIVQFGGPIMEEWKEQVTAMGVILYDYIPDFAFLARMSGVTAEGVLALDEVIWVGLYEPAYKISPHLAEAEGNITTTVLTFPNEDLATVLQSVHTLGGEVATSARSNMNGKVRLRIDAASIPSLAHMPDVLWIEPYYEPQLTNDEARTIMSVSSAWTLATPDVYGAGQTIAVFDSGIDSGNTGNIHADFRADGATCTTGATGRVQIIAYNPNCKGTDQSGHGTHVAGSVAGNGRCSGGGTEGSYASSFAGVAPQASIVLQDSDNDGDSDLECVPDLDTALFTDAYNAGARLHTNSWGSSGSDGAYTAYSQEVDNYTWQNKDFTILFAAGNTGEDDNRDGVIDSDHIDAPGTAKNCITVGATENDRPPPCSGNCGYINGRWGQGSWEPDYDVNPVHDDYMSDDPVGMASFSGQGPADDGRLKPDVVAPGTNIVSVRSSLGGTGWGEYDASYSYMGGTSMATPLAAGAAVIVRDWLQDVEGVSNPSAALIKGLLINGATDINPGQYIGNSVWPHTDPNSGDDFSYSNYIGADLSNWARSGCSSGPLTYYWDTTNADSHSAAYSAISPNVSSCEATLFMKNIVDLPSGSSPDLTFWHRFNVADDADDIGRVELSSDGGISWVTLQTYQSSKPMAWSSASMSLAGYAGQSVKIRFGMNIGSSGSVTRWYVDDVQLSPVVARSEQPSARPNNVQGWGRVNLANSIAPNSPRTLRYGDATGGLRTVAGDNEYDQVTYASSDSGEQFRATVAWTDYPGSTTAATQLVNDLDLQVTGPAGTYYSDTARNEIAYDDNAPEEGWRFSGPGAGYAVRFTPSSYPATLTKARFHIDNPNPFMIKVWDDDGSGGYPGTNLYQQLVNPGGPGWVEFDIADVDIASGDFYIEMHFTSYAAGSNDDNNPALSLDCSASSGGRSYRYDGSTWYQFPYGSSYCGTGDGRWGIRAVMNGAAFDRLNNVEGVGIDSPSDGDYTIRITAYNVPQDDPSASVDGQPYALIASGALSTLKAAHSYHYIDPGDGNEESFGAAGVTMNFASGPGGYVTVTTTKSVPSQPPPSGKAFLSVNWEVTSSMSGFSVQMVFQYDESDLPTGTNESTIRAYRWNGSSWDDEGGTIDMDANTLTVSGVTAFSEWALGGDLPTGVALTSFTATAYRDHLLVEWEGRGFEAVGLIVAVLLILMACRNVLAGRVVRPLWHSRGSSGVEAGVAPPQRKDEGKK